jgi:hypothetical protein
MVGCPYGRRVATSAYLDVTTLRLAPGGTAQCRVAVTNHGTVVESYSVRVTGALAPYASVDQSTVSLYPGTEGTAVVTFSLPVGAPVDAGDVPFAVVVEPHENPADVSIPEGVVTVDVHDALTAELTPRTSHGKGRSRHALAIDNRGNRLVVLAFEGRDPDAQLTFRFRPERLRVAPGTAAFTAVTVRANERIWRGPSMTRTFALTATEVDPDALPATPDGPAVAGPPATPVAAVDGTMVQDATLPTWLGRAILAAVVGVAALAAAWFFLLRPTIESTAEKVVAAPLKKVADQATKANEAAAAAREDASAAQEQAGSADNAAGKAAETADETRQDREQEQLAQAQQQALAGEPFNRRLAVAAPAGEVVTNSYTVPPGRILRITDLVFESPGNVGRLEVRREDQVLLSFQPENFRDLDQHFVSPIIFDAGEELVVRLSCTTPAEGDNQCRNAAYVGGSLAAKPKPSAKPKSPSQQAGG